MSECARCRQQLGPGSRHPDPEDCIEALTAENEALRARLEATCPKCHVKPVCACAVKRIARNKLNEHAPGAATAIRLLGEILKPED